jgi:trehalose synthase
MLHPSTRDRTLADYDEHLSDEHRERIRAVASDLSEASVLHVNSTPSGGGVAEMLGSLVPLLNDVGVGTDWQVVEADDPFYEVTKTIHNGLQGEDVAFTEGMRDTYRRWTEENAASLARAYDVVVLHDPQPLGMIGTLAERFPGTAFVWRCHIDLTDAAPTYLDFVQGFLERVDHAVFSRPEYGERIEGVERTTIHPAIDPLTEKNRPLSDDERRAEDERVAPLDPREDAPLLVQVSRFDPWKDPLGAVDVYERVGREFPGTRLALVGGMPDDDPEGMAVFREVREATGGDPDVHLLTDQPDTTVNHLQREADVVLQKSLREGFALTVSEALWKRTPVVGGDVGGIPLQIRDGENGYLVDPEDYPAAADRVRALLADHSNGERMGEHGQAFVRDRFLVPRLLLDYLELIQELA